MYAERYLERLRRLLARLKRQAGTIRKAAESVARSIDAGGIVHVFGTGHSHLIAEEAFYRAGGLVAVNPMLEEDLMLHRGALRSSAMERRSGLARSIARRHRMRAGDVGIVVSNSGRNAVPVEMALEMKKLGMTVIAITSLAHSRRVSARNRAGRRLFEVADLVLDNSGTYGDASVALRGVKAGPTSTVAGAALIHALMLEALARMKKPAVFVSANANGKNGIAALTRPYRNRIRYFK